MKNNNSKTHARITDKLSFIEDKLALHAVELLVDALTMCGEDSFASRMDSAIQAAHFTELHFQVLKGEKPL